MWIDYAIYLTTGVVAVSLIGLVVTLVRRRGARSTWVVLLTLLAVGVIGTVLVRPEQFRLTGEPLTVVDAVASLHTEVGEIGTCLSVFRRFGPLSFIMGTALLPDRDWDRAPYTQCETSGFTGIIDLPESVRIGQWMLCDYARCHPLTRA